jgi:hypothetical protein
MGSIDRAQARSYKRLAMAMQDFVNKRFCTFVVGAPIGTVAYGLISVSQVFDGAG